MKRILLLALLQFGSSYISCSSRSIDVENNSNYQMHILANAPDLRIDHQIPALSHSKITATVTAIPNLQNMLLNAIANNSVVQIVNAVNAGVNVNLEINGKRPLAWAVLLGHVDSIRCLVMYGATL